MAAPPSGGSGASSSVTAATACGGRSRAKRTVRSAYVKAIGSFASGLLQDWTQAYFASFSLGILGSSMGLLMFWLIRSLRREELAQVGAREAGGK